MQCMAILYSVAELFCIHLYMYMIEGVYTMGSSGAATPPQPNPGPAPVDVLVLLVGCREDDDEGSGDELCQSVAVVPVQVVAR